jgi:Ca2+:H+ antiporter
MLSYATEEIAYRTGETIGGLLNASFGSVFAFILILQIVRADFQRNAVELIVSIIALIQGQTLIVQTSLIGSMLSNLLLVLGMCFFFGGFNRVKQAFNITVAQTASSLLFLAVGALILPTAFHSFSNAGEAGIKQISRATSVLLLFVYACYIFFQLKTHAQIYNAPSEKNERKEMKGAKKTGRKMKQMAKGNFRRKSALSDGSIPDSPTDSRDANNNDQEGEMESEPQPQLSLTTAILTLAGSTVLVALNAEYLVNSINAITCDGSGISKTFVGLILLPIVGNAAEHATAVTVAVKDKMDLAIGVAVGSSMQIALLVLPFTVVLGWIIGNAKTDEMTLLFDGFQIAILFVAVLLVNYLIQDGESHWLEGILLQVLYLIIAVAAWYVIHLLRFIQCVANNILGSTQPNLDRAIAQLNSDSGSHFCSFVSLFSITISRFLSAIFPEGGGLQAGLHFSAFRCKQYGGGLWLGQRILSKMIPQLTRWALCFVIFYPSCSIRCSSRSGMKIFRL